MAGELITLMSHADVNHFMESATAYGEQGLSHTKALVLGGLGIGGTLAARKAFSQTKPKTGSRRPHFVKQGHRGLRHDRYGNYTDQIVYPGIRQALIPWKGLDQINLRDKVTPIKPFLVDSKEGYKHLIDASIIWGHPQGSGDATTDKANGYHKVIEAALTSARSEEELEQAIEEMSRSGLRMILAGMKSRKLARVDSAQVQEKLIDLRADLLLERYGSEIRFLNIGNSSTANIPISHYHPEGTGAVELGDEQLIAGALGQVAGAHAHPHLQGL